VATGFKVKQEFERRPLRLARVFGKSPLYFVTFCTHARTPCLARDEIHATFVLFAGKAERDFRIAVGRYVIMPDHVHLFVRGGPDFVLGRWVGMLKHSMGKASKLSRRDIQIWQPRKLSGFDHVLRSDESYGQKWQYVRENPVRAGLVSCSEDWPYQGEIVYIDRA
jgi:putative transposase